jgi:hypothetical protein
MTEPSSLPVPEFRAARLRDIMLLTGNTPMDKIGGVEVIDLIYAEAVATLRDAGIDASDDEADSPEESMLAAVMVAYTNGLVAGHSYAKLPRRL